MSILKRKEDKSDFLSKVPEQYRWPWIGLIVAAGDSPVKGKVCIQEGLPFHEDQLSRLLDTTHLKEALKCFENLDMIMYDKNGIIIINHYEIYQSEWERLQKYLTDKDLPTHLPTPLNTPLPNTNAVILPSITLSTCIGSKEVNEVIICWNDFSAQMRKQGLDIKPIKAMSGNRKKTLNARLKEQYFRDNYKQAIGLIIKRPFCMGENDRGWVATFEWFIRPDTVIDLMEGSKWMNGKQPTRSYNTLTQDEKDLREKILKESGE